MKKINSILLLIILSFSSLIFAEGNGGVISKIQMEENLVKPSSEKTSPQVQILTDTSQPTNTNTNRTDIPMKITTLNAQQATFDNSDPRANIKTVQYNPKVIYKLAVREVMGTTIVFPEREGIDQHILGDEDYWSFETSGELLDATLPRIATVHAYMPGTDTSLTVIGTSGNVYTFYLRSYTWQSDVDPTLTFYINDDHLQNKLDSLKLRKYAQGKAEREQQARIDEEMRQRRLEREKNDYLTEVSVNPEDFDFGYILKGGDESLAPYHVFDDGVFTYFKFDDKSNGIKNRDLPVVYKVIDKSDTPTNTTVVGARTLRVEGIANAWTLRLGDKYLCVKRKIALTNPSTNMNTVEQ